MKVILFISIANAFLVADAFEIKPLEVSIRTSTIGSSDSRGRFVVRHVSLSSSPPSEAFDGLLNNVNPNNEKVHDKVAPVTSNVDPLEAAITKASIIMYIISMCIALPLALFPISMQYKYNKISKTEREQRSLEIGQTCAKTLLKMFPFAKLTVQRNKGEDKPDPSIWVCNHTSMLDTFLLLAMDEHLRGKNKRPIKTVYWKGLESNPITCMLFQNCGFIPVDMADNGNGNTNEYDKKSFISMLKKVKKAFNDGYDLLMFPEGQLNPNPVGGLLDEVYAGAHALSATSKRPIRFVGIHGLHNLWSPNDTLLNANVKDRNVSLKTYPPFNERYGNGFFENGDQFVYTFRSIVGHFGSTGKDLPTDEMEKYFSKESLSHHHTHRVKPVNRQQMETFALAMYGIGIWLAQIKQR